MSLYPFGFKRVVTTFVFGVFISLYPLRNLRNLRITGFRKRGEK